jgi:hypothetical protein
MRTHPTAWRGGIMFGRSDSFFGWNGWLLDFGKGSMIGSVLVLVSTLLSERWYFHGRLEEV